MPDDAYRFARGEEVMTSHGEPFQLSRPLDWLVISDHAEMYGLMPKLLAGDPAWRPDLLWPSLYPRLMAGLMAVGGGGASLGTRRSLVYTISSCCTRMKSITS